MRNARNNPRDPFPLGSLRKGLSAAFAVPGPIPSVRVWHCVRAEHRLNAGQPADRPGRTDACGVVSDHIGRMDGQSNPAFHRASGREDGLPDMMASAQDISCMLVCSKINCATANVA